MFAAASILVSIGGLFIESGITAALIHRQDRIEEAIATAFIAVLASGIILTIVSAALAPVVGWLFDGQDIVTNLAFAIAGVHLLNALHVVPNALLQREFAYVRKAVIEPVALGTYGVVAAAGLVAGWGAWALAGGLYASGLVRVALAWALAALRPRPRLASFAMWRELAGYGRHVLTSEILRRLGSMAQVVGIGRVLGTADLGQFNFGNRIASLAGSPIVTGAANVLFPAFARLSSDQERLGAAFCRALASLCFITVPLSFALLAFGESLAVLLLGRRWELAGEVLASLSLVGAALAVISISSRGVQGNRPAGSPTAIAPRLGTGPTVAVGAGVWFGVVAIGACTSLTLAMVAFMGLRAASRVVGVSRRALAAIVVAPVTVAGSVAVCLFLVERYVVDSPSHRDDGWSARSRGPGSRGSGGLCRWDEHPCGGSDAGVLLLLPPSATAALIHRECSCRVGEGIFLGRAVAGCCDGTTSLPVEFDHAPRYSGIISRGCGAASTGARSRLPADAAVRQPWGCLTVREGRLASSTAAASPSPRSPARSIPSGGNDDSGQRNSPKASRVSETRCGSYPRSRPPPSRPRRRFRRRRRARVAAVREQGADFRARRRSRRRHESRAGVRGRAPMRPHRRRGGSG